MIILYFFLNIFDMYLNYMLLNSYFEKKEWLSSRKLFLLVVSITVLGIGIKSYMESAPVNFLVGTVSVLLLCLLCFDGQTKVMITCISFYFFLWLCLDTLVGVGIIRGMGIKADSILKEANLQELAFFIYVFLKFIVVQFIRKRRNHSLLEGEGKLHLIQMVIPLVSCIGIVYLLDHEIKYSSHSSVSVYMMIVFCVINVIQYYVFEELNKLQYEHIEDMRVGQLYKYKDDYYQELEKHQLEIRTIRHDLKNQLIILKTYLDKNDYQLAQLEVNTILQDVIKLESCQFTANQIVNALLNAKYKQACESNIQCDFTVSLPERLNMSDRDLVILLGNLLDNCIEACQKVEGERKFSLNILYNNSAIIIHSRNNTDGQVKGIVTRKINKAEHGLGLKSIRAIVSKYRGNVDLNIEDHAFYTNIILWDVGKKIQ